VARSDLPSGLGFKGVTPPGEPSRCFTAPVRKLNPAGTADGRLFIGNRSRTLVSSLAWSFADDDAASEALAAVATIEAVDCFGKQNARGSAPTLKYLSADKLDFPTVGDETVAYRGDYRVEGDPAVGDYIFVRTGRVLTAVGFQSLGGAPKQSTVKAVLERVVARVRDSE
jgi:hypothetical protein